MLGEKGCRWNAKAFTTQVTVMLIAIWFEQTRDKWKVQPSVEMRLKEALMRLRTAGVWL
jgi:hypothetical protein